MMHIANTHRRTGRVTTSLILAGSLAVTLVSGDGLDVQAAPPSATHETIQNSITTHDGNQTSQHNALSGQATTHDAAQTAHDSAKTTQHNALSQQITNLSTGGGHSGLPQVWDKTLPANDPGGACPANSSRFTCVFGGAAIRDNQTGLVWEQAPSILDRP